MKATDDEPTAILPTRTVPSWTTVDDRVMGGVSRSSIEASGDGVAWQLGFATSAGEWTEVKLPFRDYTASYRGRRLPEMGPIEPGRIRQLGLTNGRDGRIISVPGVFIGIDSLRRGTVLVRFSNEAPKAPRVMMEGMPILGVGRLAALVTFRPLAGR